MIYFALGTYADVTQQLSWLVGSTKVGKVVLVLQLFVVYGLPYGRKTFDV